VRFAGIDDGLELGVGQQIGGCWPGASADSSAWAARPLAIAADCTSLVGCGLSAGNADRLQSVFFIDRVGQAAAFAGVQSTVS
jgi:hypothetical protein